MSKKKSEGKAGEKVKKSKASPEPVVAETQKAAPAKSATKKKTALKSTPAKKPATKKARRPTDEEIALRAYFIAERRQNLGWFGDETQDWVEAERQLLKEAGLKA
ncbi:MAG: DUF2934 domain-containing protein [Terrimicrobiaceae bacterium]